MDHNQILLDAVIEFPSQLLGENSDGQQQEGSLLLPQANQLPISNQNMVEMGKKLLEAASENNLESVRSLMTGGAPFTGNWLGTTPLHAAAKAGHIETVELLLKAGIFRDAKTKVDRTALQMAAEEGYTTIVQMLLEHGADINSKDMLRMTALHWAVERGHRDVVTVLLSYGADVLVLNKFDKTAMDIACDNGFQDIALQLEAAMLQRNNKTHNPIVNGRTEAVRHINSSHETSSVKSPIWKTSPEEDALEKLTANTLNSESTSHEALKLLESHGISFLPVDNSTLLTSALESGQSISLTEAGKMALNHLKKNSHPVAQPAKTTPVAKKPKLSSTPGHPRVVTITAEQFMAIAGRLQSRGNGTGKPVIFSLPKNFSLSAEKISNTKLATPLAATTVAASKAPIPKLDSNARGSITSKNMQNSLTTESATEAKSSQLHLSMPILTEDEPCSEPTSIDVKSTNGQYHEDHIPAPSEFDFVSSQDVSMPSLDISSPSIAMIETNNNPGAMHNSESTNSTPTVNSGTDDMKFHFFKSGQLKGSARTTPMTILCQKKRRKSVTLEEAEEEDCQINAVALASMHSRSAQTQGQQHHQPTLNNAAPPLDADDDMFVNEESESCQGNNNPPVWLSIMEEENSQFSAGAADNDDDLLDPSRLAAQLASIRQAASQYSFSS